ncbi:hypothetical protein ON010_g19050 [Phytophthora cinnamomi]|nr:hypothetical protein ON010_g19050 [Phytophthora cinnamomi]
MAAARPSSPCSVAKAAVTSERWRTALHGRSGAYPPSAARQTAPLGGGCYRATATATDPAAREPRVESRRAAQEPPTVWRLARPVSGGHQHAAVANQAKIAATSQRGRRWPGQLLAAGYCLRVDNAGARGPHSPDK